MWTNTWAIMCSQWAQGLSLELPILVRCQTTRKLTKNDKYWRTQALHAVGFATPVVTAAASMRKAMVNIRLLLQGNKTNTTSSTQCGRTHGQACVVSGLSLELPFRVRYQTTRQLTMNDKYWWTQALHAVRFVTPTDMAAASVRNAMVNRRLLL